MVRLIVSYQVYRIVHDCIDETHVEYQHLIESVEPPTPLLHTYKLLDIIDRNELQTYHLDRVIPHSSLCRRVSHPDSMDSIPLEFQTTIKRCETEYWFASSGYLVEPKWTQYKLEYDEVMAEHDGYCSDAELEWVITPLSLCVYVPIEPERLGIDEEDDNDNEIPVTPAIQHQFEKYKPSRHRQGCGYGSGYCLTYNNVPQEYDSVTECNTPFYILQRCTRV